MAKYKKTRTISASNQFTDAAELQGYFNVSVSGTFTATITAQRSSKLVLGLSLYLYTWGRRK